MESLTAVSGAAAAAAVAAGGGGGPAGMKRKRRRSLSQLSPAETLSQLLLNLPGNKLNNNDDQKNVGSFLFGNGAGSGSGPANASSNTTHGTSAGFCNICQKFVSNRTNHKYVHSQVFTAQTLRIEIAVNLTRTKETYLTFMHLGLCTT